MTKNNETFIKESQKKHINKNGKAKYDYSISVYQKAIKKVAIICHEIGLDGIEHGIFYQTPNKHLCGQGCPSCAGNKKIDIDTFIKRSKIIHKDKEYDYSQSNCLGSKKLIYIICHKIGLDGKEHGGFWQEVNNHMSGHGCPTCANELFISKPENEVYLFINEKNILEDLVIQRNVRNILSNNLELDIFIPSLNIAFEYNGLYWHSDVNKSKNYHLNKTIQCEKNNIKLFHIWEDEWVNNTNIIKYHILKLLNPNKNNILNYEIKEVKDESIIFNFIVNNSLYNQTKTEINIGLFCNNELISLIGLNYCNNGSYYNKIFYNKSFEIIYFCDNINNNEYNNTFNKLLYWVIDTYQPNLLKTNLVDRTFPIYEKELLDNNFIFIKNIKPVCYNIINGLRVENNLVDNDTLSQPKIYDCGKKVYYWFKK